MSDAAACRYLEIMAGKLEIIKIPEVKKVRRMEITAWADKKSSLKKISICFKQVGNIHKDQNILLGLAV